MPSARTYDPAKDILIRTTPVFEWNYNAEARVKINQGGTSSGKTYSILQVLALRAIEKERIITITGQDIPNLKSGALRDFESRVLVNNPDISKFIVSYHKSERIFTFKNGSIIEFKAFEDAQDAKNGKRNDLFVNEANGIPYDVYQQLAMRTSESIYIDYNPTTSFWAHDNLIGTPDTVVFYSNFTHNPYCDQAIIDHVRRYKETDPEAWRVYGLGKTGNITGLIFSNVEYVPELPQVLKKRVYGLDFGFANDPTALVEIGELHGHIYGRELIYNLGMTNKDISEEMRRIGVSRGIEIYADSAEPKSIEELRREGWWVKPAKKGPDSVRFGISEMKSRKWCILAESRNWKKEQQNYKWKEKDGIGINQPVDSFNHCWDAARYAYTAKFHGSFLPGMV